LPCIFCWFLGKKFRGIYVLGKNAGLRLFDNPARMGGKCLQRGISPQKNRGNIAKQRSGGSRRRFDLILFFKEGRFL